MVEEGLRRKWGVAVFLSLVALVFTSAPVETQAEQQGSALVLFETRSTAEAEEVTLCAQLLSLDGTLLWGSAAEPLVIPTPGLRVRHPAVTPDGTGGLFVAFEGERERCHIYAQRMSSDGELLWNSGRGLVAVTRGDWDAKRPAIVSDGQGGAIVVFEQHAPTGSRYAGDVDLAAQRLSADGQALWNGGEKAVTVSAEKWLELSPVAIPDGAGGAIIAFMAEFTEGEWKGDVDIFAQRISAEGKSLWQEGLGAVTVAGGSWPERKPVLIPGVNGTAIALYEEYGAADSEHANDVDVACQWISPDGEILWGEQEDASVEVSAARLVERDPRAASDGAAGIFVVFTVHHRSDTTDPDIYAQHISAERRAVWLGGERPLLVAGSRWAEDFPVAVSDGAGGLLVIYQEQAPDGQQSDIAAQGLSADGRPRWGALKEAKAVLRTAGLVRRPEAMTDGAGGALIVCQAERGTDHVELVAQRIDGQGSPLWGGVEQPLVVASGKGVRTVVALVPLTQ